MRRWKVLGIVSVLAALAATNQSSLFAQSWTAREVNLNGSDMDTHYEAYGYLASAPDRMWLESQEFIIADDFDFFAVEVNTIDFGNDGGSFGDQVTNNPDSAFLAFSGMPEDYGIAATANVHFDPGTYTIAVGSDDGAQLTMPGAGFFGQYNITDPNGRGTGDQFWFRNNRGHGWTGASFTVGPGGLDTQIFASFHERGGGDSFEVAIRPGGPGSQNAAPGTSGWELLTDGSLSGAITMSPTTDIPIPARSAANPAPISVPGQAGLPIGIMRPSSAVILNTDGDGTEMQPGLFQRWVNVNNPGNLNAVVNALVANDGTSVRFHDETTWWDGNSTDFGFLQEYPAGIDGAFGTFQGDPNGNGQNNDQYIAWLSGEINLTGGDTLFRLAVDDYKYFALDLGGSGIAGDQPGEVLMNDNNWVNTTGWRDVNNDNPYPNPLAVNVPEDGWYKVEIIMAEGGGGDEAVLYWDEGNEGNFPLTAPFEEGGMFNAEDYIVPGTALRSVTRGDITGTQLIAQIGPGSVLNMDVSSDLNGSDKIVLLDDAFDTLINLDGVTINVNAVDELLQGDSFVLFDADEIMGQAGVIFNLPGDPADWDVSGFMAGTDNRIYFGEGGGPGGIPGDINGDGSVDLVDFNILKANFGAMAGAAGGQESVPEPSTLVLLGLGGLVGLVAAIRRRRS